MIAVQPEAEDGRRWEGGGVAASMLSGTFKILSTHVCTYAIYTCVAYICNIHLCSVGDGELEGVI